MYTILVVSTYVSTNICQEIFIMLWFRIYIISNYDKINSKFHNYNECCVLSDMKNIKKNKLGQYSS